jgi:hypothetical protein
MSQIPTLGPRVLHRLPGRFRVHLTGWSGQRPREIEQAIARVPGVHAARADSLTGNVLVHFDPRSITEARLTVELDQVAAEVQATPAGPEEPGTPSGNGLRLLAGHVLSEVLFGAVLAVEPFGLPIAVFWALQLGFSALFVDATIKPDPTQACCASAA